MDALRAGHSSRARTIYGLENPADRQGQYASMFHTTEAAALRRDCVACYHMFDQCMYGPDFKKATGLLSSAIMVDMDKTCTHGRKGHESLSVQNPDGM